MKNVKVFSLIEELESRGIEYFVKENFNFSSIKRSEISKISVCLLSDINNEQTQVLYDNKELLSIKAICKQMGDNSYRLNRDFAPRESLPLGNFIYLQPFMPKQNVNTLVSKDVIDSTYSLLYDRSKDLSILVRTSEFLEIFDYNVINFRQKQNQVSSNKIEISKDIDIINAMTMESSAGAMKIKDSHTEITNISSSVINREIIIPLFPNTIEEILLNEPGELIECEYILDLFNIDHLLEAAFILKVHKLFPILEHKSITTRQIIHYVGSERAFSWIMDIAKASDKKKLPKELLDFYYKFSSHVNVASEVCNNIVEYILDNQKNIHASGFDRNKMLMVSRLVYFPILLLVANLTEEEYEDLSDHFILNPSHNALEVCDLVLGFNEIDFVAAIIGNDSHIPKFIENTFREQYSPMYNGTGHLYPNINYIARNLMGSHHITQNTVLAPSKKMAYTLGKRIGIDESTLEDLELQFPMFKKQAIEKNKIHIQKKSIGQKEIKGYLDKFAITIF